MKRRNSWPIFLWAAAILTGGVDTGCSQKPQTPQPQATMAKTNQSNPAAASPRVRLPAVAGLFYPKDPAELAKTIDGFLAAARAETMPNLKGLVCPHAGYQYSGPTAAFGYKQLAGRDYQTVIVLAPSHYAPFDGASVINADSYQTPLGSVPVSAKARQLAGHGPFVLEPRCPMQRPRWWFSSSRPAPLAGEDTPETWEHSGEVQVPFLQRVLKDFKLVSVVFGEADPEEAARALAGVLDDQTLLVASSDLSHYHPYDAAKSMDTKCVKAICDLDIAAMRRQEACGKTPILTLMHLARQNGWKTRLLDYRNSGDTAGDRSGVVGYAAIAFYTDTPANPGRSPAHKASQGPVAPAVQAKAGAVAQDQMAKKDKEFLLRLARQTLKAVVNKRPLPEVKPDGLARQLAEPGACFVTLTKRGALRGCIGHLTAREPLYRSVMENAESAALRDYRFSPVQPEEVDKLEIEISVLTEPKPLSFSSPEDLLNKLVPRQDGVILQIGPARATYLPQVWEQLPDKVTFMNSLAQKAGCEAAAWRQPGTAVQIYHVEAFKEAEFKQ
jgi:hypothetical protein